MTYDQQILQILTEVGPQGISVRFLAKHVYNLNLSLFFTPDLEEIHTYVQQFLLKHARSPQSLIESTGRRGWYRLNTNNSDDARQLMFDFKEAHTSSEQTEEEKPQNDLSLSLFD